MSDSRTSVSGRALGPPWTRLLFSVLIAFPALAIGGVPSWVVPAFVVGVLALMLRQTIRSSAPVRIPPVAGVFALLATATLLQWAPIPGVRSLLASGLEAEVASALTGSGLESPAGLTVTPPDTGLEAARLLGLTALVVAAAQISWRIPAAVIAALGTIVALAGFVHELAGTDAIYGLYHPVDALPSVALRTTFVNPNHQSGLLLLGIFCTGACAHELADARARTTDGDLHERYGDWLVAAMGSLFVQIPALVLSLSRGAILALLLLGPIALWVGTRSGGAKGRRSRRRRGSSTPRVLFGLALTLAILLVAQHRAWGELASLRDLSAEEPKLHMVTGGLDLVGLSPILGVGRGGFIDLYPPLSGAETPILYTHLESAPVAAIVEWGPLVAAVALLGLVLWWVSTLRSAGRRKDSTARRILLLGLLALAVQQTADFGLEFLGIAAPAAALVGSLSTKSGKLAPATTVRNISAVSLLAALVLALACRGQTWTHRVDLNGAVVRGEIDASAQLLHRPLDGRLHAAIARHAFEQGDLETARSRAETASERFPPAMEPWWVLAAYWADQGDEERTAQYTREALDRIASRPSPELQTWLLQRFADPAALAAVVPTRRSAWVVLMAALRETAPDHADALAEAWSREHPDDPLAHRHRAWIARKAGRPALALHHARLLRATEPGTAGSHLVLVQALEMFATPRTDEMIEALEQGLKSLPENDISGRGQLEQRLLELLLERGRPSDRARAEELAELLLARPAKDRSIRAHREQLVRQVPQKVW